MVNINNLNGVPWLSRKSRFDPYLDFFFPFLPHETKFHCQFFSPVPGVDTDEQISYLVRSAMA